MDFAEKLDINLIQYLTCFPQFCINKDGGVSSRKPQPTRESSITKLKSIAYTVIQAVSCGDELPYHIARSHL